MTWCLMILVVDPSESIVPGCGASPADGWCPLAQAGFREFQMESAGLLCAFN